MALALHERGLFTWNEWAATLAKRSSPLRRKAIPILARPIIGIGSRRWSGWSRQRDRRADAHPLPRGLAACRRPHAPRHADRATDSATSSSDGQTGGWVPSGTDGLVQPAGVDGKLRRMPHGAHQTERRRGVFKQIRHVVACGKPA